MQLFERPAASSLVRGRDDPVSKVRMRILFERRIENLVRQFQGQTMEGKLFGLEGQAVLPFVCEAGSVHIDDPRG